MIQRSGHFEYDPNLDEFYDYERYGLQHMGYQSGVFTDRGYICLCRYSKSGGTDGRRPGRVLSAGAGLSDGRDDMIQLFMSRSGSSVIVPLNLPASHGAMTEAYSQLEQANRTGKTEIVEIKSVIANLPSYLRRTRP